MKERSVKIQNNQSITLRYMKAVVFAVTIG